jgi:BAAT / Acyl-CoA thioester hydrolase C terminal
VVGIVPSDVVWEGWGPTVAGDDTRSSFAWDGQPLAYVPYRGMTETIAALSRGERRAIRTPHDDGRAANPARVAAAKIPVERFTGELLVAGGDRDGTWASGYMVRNIAARRAQAGLPTAALVFPNAGHALSGSGWEPTNYPGIDADAGANAAAQAAVRTAMLAMLGRVLKP